MVSGQTGENVIAGLSVRTSAPIRLPISGTSLTDLSARRLSHLLNATHLIRSALNNDV